MPWLERIVAGVVATLNHTASLLPRVQEDFPRHEVPNHDNGGRTDFGDEVMDAEQLNARPHAQIIDAQANDRKHDEYGELAAFAHALLVREHIAHGSRVVEHDGRRERNGRAHQVVHAENFGQECQDAIVDAEGDHAHHAKLHELCDEFLHDAAL